MTRTDGDCVVLIAEDDDNDYLLTEKAFRQARFTGRLHRVRDGVELTNYLQSEAVENTPILLLLLDLNMPRKDGREALREIKSSRDLRAIPIVVLTTSGSETDIRAAYELGANSFIRKPAAFEEFVDCIACLRRYWFEVAELPRQPAREKI